MKQWLAFALVILALKSFSQTAPVFITPDTVCVGQEVNIVNIITGSSYYWNFCTANAGYPPQGFSNGNPGGLFIDPRFITLAKDSLDCYSFVTCPGVPGVIRNYYGDSYFHPPVSSMVDIFSVLTTAIRGIQMKKDNGTWYGFGANGSNLVKMVFNNGLGNSPSVSAVNLPGILSPTGLEFVQDGANWITFLVEVQGNALHRLDFGTSLNNSPTFTDLGNVGQMSTPSGIALKKENGQWYMLVCNTGNSTLTRISFGTDLTNPFPTGENLGNVGGLNVNTGISLIQDCERLNGYIINHSPGPDPLIKLNFNGGMAGNITGTPMGNPAGLNQPYGISEMLRAGDTIYACITNPGDSTLSLVYFPVCSASSMPAYNGPVPPPITYSVPGNYNIFLTVDDGTALQTGSCNNIVVIPKPIVALGPDRIICDGDSVVLDAGAGFSSYLWNNGVVSQTLISDTSGTFSVSVTNRFGCEARDTATITVVSEVAVTVDTAICHGEGYFAGGRDRFATGVYYDSLQTAAGCDSVVVTNLMVHDSIPLDLGQDTTFCPGDLIILDASFPGSTYEWQNGTTDSLFLVVEPGLYWVIVTREGCSVSDSVTILPCPVRIWFPNAFTPDNDGVNDTFRPRGISIGIFSMEIYDRWGSIVFETNDINQGWNGMKQGALCESGSYSYIARYSSIEEPGKIYKIRGTVTLVR